MGLGNRFRHDVEVVELVVAHAQAVARLTGVDGVGAIGEGVTHAFVAAGGREQFGFHGRGRGMRLGILPAAAGPHGGSPLIMSASG